MLIMQMPSKVYLQSEDKEQLYIENIKWIVDNFRNDSKNQGTRRDNDASITFELDGSVFLLKAAYKVPGSEIPLISSQQFDFRKVNSYEFSSVPSLENVKTKHGLTLLCNKCIKQILPNGSINFVNEFSIKLLIDMKKYREYKDSLAALKLLNSG